MTNPRQRANLHIKAVDENVLVHDVDGEKVHVLNPSAARILELCDGTHTHRELVEALRGDADVPDDVVAKDVDELLAAFRSLELVLPE